MPATKQQINAALAVTLAVAEAIRELGEVPSSTLYANVMSKIDFPSYTGILSALAGAGLIQVQNHLIRWTGPALTKK